MSNRVSAIIVRTIVFLIVGVGAVRSNAAELSRKESDLFERHARPILTAHCIKCHGEAKQEGGLRLTTLDELITGGDSGPAIVAGKPDESLIIEAIRYESYEMPPEEPLDDEIINGLVDWIAAGAAWPEDVQLTTRRSITDEDRDWWCYQPIAAIKPPQVAESAWGRNEIDGFVHRRLVEKELQPADQATPMELVRRASFAITGLPPSDDAVKDAMSADFDYEAYVDQLLDSEAYGENQARFWLDLVRYADSDGYRADFNRPDAYLYRDYVIRSFNADKPYDQFIREQLAGDEIDPGNRDAIIATMYLRHWIYEHNNRDVENQWHEILSDITETTSDVFLAQGLKCARCHDHKFDPLLQNDYFRIKAFFAALQPVSEHPVADVATRAAYRKQLANYNERTKELRSQLREIEYPVALEHATREGFDKFIVEIQTMVKKPASEREPYEQQIASMAERQFDLPYEKLDQWLSEEQQAERAKLKARLAKLDHLKPKPLSTVKFVATDVGPIAPTNFNPDDSDRVPVVPGFITLLDESDAAISPTPAALQTTGRRTALANWIASADNPLTARVIVNRIWQQHFGRGLVATSSDFGRLGTPPTHPELLDYMAKQFVADGWSFKQLHRLILTSATYRQTSRRPMDRSTSRIDPTNELFWRMNPRRLSGEEIIDAILTSGGELAATKRAIYKKVERNSPDPLLKTFDGPDRIRSSGRRHRTTTSTQSLLLGNSSWAHERADSIVRHLVDSQGMTDTMLVRRAYRKLFSRDPTGDEVALAEDFVKRYAERTPVEEPRPTVSLAKLPGDAGLAVRLSGTSTSQIKLGETKGLPDSDFTVEAHVLLESLYKDASVRTIATHWNGSNKSSGWSLGVTSQKSSYKPRNLILQLVGKTDKGDQLQYEVVASGLRVPLNKPCFVAASVDLSDATKAGVTFYLRDLSDPDAVLQVSNVEHTVTSAVRGTGDFVVGSRHGKHRWDGLIGSVRIENKRRDLALVAQADSDAGLPQYSVDYRFDLKESIGLDSSGSHLHAVVSPKTPPAKTPRQRARVALIHALMNSNELIYVD
ncbi:DUF1553 domain-containing protein [Planctomycetes bacterium K23_9]|uniref:Planctomycete cytochrome C n=1 Tax=Stieleria marina TaxID=1930275 RepID=A0A517NTA5_9BACT|nr:Planctomycete cytochrome C [Planctomycetes bacterium K23_9]